MKHIVLDTSIIVRDPGILARRSDGIELHVPKLVISELGRGEHDERGKAFKELIDEAIAAGTIVVPTASQPAIPERRLADFADGAVLKLALWLKAEHNKPSDETHVATVDRRLASLAEEYQIPSLDLEELRTLLRGSDRAPDARTQQLANSINRRDWLSLGSGSLLSALAGAGVSYLFDNPDALARAVREWGIYFFGVLAPVVGVLLFWIRARYRLLYGISELFIGAITAIHAVVLTDAMQNSQPLPVLLQILGGLYIMVRGLDNIGTGLERTQWKARWDGWFGYPEGSARS